MIKVFKIIFIYLIILGSCYSRGSDPFGKITLKLNGDRSKEYSPFVNFSGKFSNDFQTFYVSTVLNRKKSIEKDLLEQTTSVFGNNYKESFNDSLYDAQDGIDQSLNKKYPLWLPIAEVVGLNAGIGMFNSYVTESHFARISFKTISKNFQTGSVWDHDHFITNFFAHPYHGNLYFNTARSTGYSFWESVPFSFGGSLMWELFMENEPPSLNDLINTTVSGYFLGETLYRLSSLIIDERKTGFERVYREVFAGLLNPARGFNRLITGETSRVTNNRAFVQQPIVIEVTAGPNWILQGQNFLNGDVNTAINFRMVYGNPFKKEHRRPFDFIRLRSQFNIGGNDTNLSPIGMVSAYGILAGKNLFADKDEKVLVGIFQHYDFFDNTVYKTGGISFGAGIITQFPVKIEGSSIMTSLHLNYMPLGASNSAYSAFGEKEYNFSTGLNMKFESWLGFSWGLFGLTYNLFWDHTIIGTPSNEFIGLLRPRLEVNIVDHINLGTEFVFYHREGYYRDYPDVFLRNNEVKIFVGYTFDNFGTQKYSKDF